MSIKGDLRIQSKMEVRANNNSSLRILVVDDEPSILTLVKTALETRECYQISIARSAFAAINVIEAAKQPFDFFLFDIQMPDTNGIELLRKVRGIPEYTDTPVLFLTAMTDRKYVDDAFMDGANDYVTKPFDFLDLLRRIHVVHSLVMSRRKDKNPCNAQAISDANWKPSSS